MPEEIWQNYSLKKKRTENTSNYRLGLVNNLWFYLSETLSVLIICIGYLDTWTTVEI